MFKVTVTENVKDYVFFNEKENVYIFHRKSGMLQVENSNNNHIKIVDDNSTIAIKDSVVIQKIADELIISSKVTSLSFNLKDFEAKPQYDTPVHKLAELLHTKTCRGNHVDDCSWFYDINAQGIVNWNNYSHKAFFERATKMVNNSGMSAEDIMRVVQHL